MTSKKKVVKSTAKTSAQSIQFASLISPILSISIMVLGMGAITTYTSLRLHDFGADEWLIGLVSAFYFFGMTVGGYKVQHLILRVGHIRTFAACSSLFGVTCLLQGIFEYPWLWILFRFTAGLSLSGCFLVIESWLLGASTPKNRGIILAIYMISYYAGQAVGNLILKTPGLAPIDIYIIAAIFFALSLLPVTLTRFHAPYAEEPNILSFRALLDKAPISFWGAMAAGFTLSVLYSLYPLYLSYTNWQQGDVALFMSFLLIGATIAQYPIGWLSDKIDRRIVILFVLVAFLVVFSLIWLQHDNFYLLLVYSTLLGGFAFTIYPLSINHGVDHFTNKDLISATAAIMLAYGVGSCLGPGVVSLSMELFGINGFIIMPVFIAIILLLYILYRLLYLKSAKGKNKGHYVPLPDTTFEVMQMDPDVKEKYIKSRHIDKLENH